MAKVALHGLDRVVCCFVAGALVCLAAPSSAQQSAGELPNSAVVTAPIIGEELALAHEENDEAPQRSGGFAIVRVSRAADLVGRPLDIISRPKIQAGSGSLPSGAPLTNAVVTSGFGNRRHPILGGWRRHAGLDLAAPYGSEIRATADGVVARAERNGGYGLYIALKHPSGVETSYGHMSRLNVSAGQSVRRGQVIGYVGSTGLATGPHLHYEIRVNGQPIDPAKVRQ